jgi:hypothetical protein
MIAAAALLGFAATAPGQGGVGQPAPDFPPGLFSDGKAYSLAELRGKLVVLYIYESG